MGSTCPNNASTADRIPETSRYGFESYAKELGMNVKYNGKLLEAYRTEE